MKKASGSLEILVVASSTSQTTRPLKNTLQIAPNTRKVSGCGQRRLGGRLQIEQFPPVGRQACSRDDTTQNACPRGQDNIHSEQDQGAEKNYTGNQTAHCSQALVIDTHEIETGVGRVDQPLVKGVTIFRMTHVNQNIPA